MKRITKVAVSLAVWSWDGLERLLLRVIGRRPRGSCVVLLYHGVRPGERARFARQMDGLLRLTRVLPADYRGEFEDGRRYSMVTFDDGLLSVAENAIPELIKRNIPCTLFIPTAFLGSRARWMKDGATQETQGRAVLSAEAVAALGSSDLVAIGSHCVSHRGLLALEPEQALQEMAESRQALGLILRRPVTLLSFPFGEYTENHVRWAVQCGYVRAFGAEPERLDGDLRNDVVGRINVEPGDWLLEYRLKVLGAYRWMSLASRLKRLLFGGS